jgi:Rrf2 family nitric oxide-sensitive transcriptional repressor
MNQCVSPTAACKLMPICSVNVLFCEMQRDIEKKLKNAKIKEFLFENRDRKLVN